MQTDTDGIWGKPIAWRKFPVSIWLSIHPSYITPYSIYLKILKQNIFYSGGTTSETYTGHARCLNVFWRGGGCKVLLRLHHIFILGEISVGTLFIFRCFCILAKCLLDHSSLQHSDHWMGIFALWSRRNLWETKCFQFCL